MRRRTSIRPTVLMMLIGALCLTFGSPLACEPGKPYGSGTGDCGGGRAPVGDPSASSVETPGWGRSGFSHLISLNHNRANSECNPWLTADESEIFFIIYDGEYEPPQPGWQGDWDIYVSERDPVSGDWGPSTNLGPNVNTAGPDRRPSTTATGDTLFFSRPNGVYVSIRAGGEFGPATYLFPGSDPAVTADGMHLYFVRAGDIWIADRAGGITQWLNHRSIGPPVNTAASEVRPFVTADGTRLFFSDFGGPRVGGYGGGDIWVSTWTGSAWGAPVNFGPPVNTDRETCTPFMNRIGTRFYTGSEAFEGSRGCEDIWEARLDESPAPRLVLPQPGIWTKMGELDGAWNVYDIAEGPDGALYAATMPGAVVFKSVDGGLTWTPTAPLPGNPIIAYSILCADDGTLFVGTYPQGDVYRSVSGGAAWQPTANLPGSTAVRALTKTADGRILAGTSPLCRVFATANGGASWTQLGATFGMMNSVTRLYETEAGVLLAGGWGKLNRSTDDGLHWVPASLPAVFGGEVASIETFREIDGALWSGGWVHGHGGYVFRSVDGGATWDTTASITIGVKRAVRVYDLIDAPDGRLFIGLQPGPDLVALASADAGESWTIEGSLDGAHEILRYFKSNDGSLLAATTPNGDIYRWTPGTNSTPESPAVPSTTGVGAVIGGTPNPFRRSTTVRYQVAVPGAIDLSVTDVRGRRVRHLTSGSSAPGLHELDWNGRDDVGRVLPSGVYFLRLATARRVTWQRIIKVG